MLFDISLVFTSGYHAQEMACVEPEEYFTQCDFMCFIFFFSH